VSAIYDIPHGGGLAIIFPNWARYVLDAGTKRFYQFAVRVMHVDPTGKSERQVAEEGIDALRAFFDSIGAPKTLGDYGIDGENLDKMAQHAVKRGAIGGYKVLQKEEGRFTGLDGEVLLDFLALFSPKGWIGQNHIEPVFVLNIADVLGKGIRVEDIGGLNTVQDHVHDRNDIGETLLFLTVASSLLQGFDVIGRQAGFAVEVIKRFAQESRRANGPVIDALTDGWLYHLDDGADQGTRRVIFSTIPAGVPHVLDLGFIQVRELMFFGLGTKAQTIDDLSHFPQVVATLKLVFNLPEDLTDLVFDCVGSGGSLFESAQIRKQLMVDKILEVITGHCPIVIKLSAYRLRGGPAFPSEIFFKDEVVRPSLKFGFHGLVLFQGIKVLEEQKP